MWNPTTRPIYHDEVTIPVVGRAAGMRVIVVEGGALASVARYFEDPRNAFKSPSWQAKCCRALGLFYDYLHAVGAGIADAQKPAFLSDFILALTCGSQIGPGEDPSGLGWRALSFNDVQDIAGYVRRFADYCLGYESIPAIGEASFADRIAAFRRLDLKKRNSLLGHTALTKNALQKALKDRSVITRRAPKVHLAAPPTFPRGRFNELLVAGFVRLGATPTDPDHLRWNIRDQMVAVLQYGGGIRESEALNLFVTDVRSDRANTQSARVLLSHPEIARMRYRDPATGASVDRTRAEFLRDVYGLAPRNTIAGKQRAGWKDLLLDAGKPHYYAEVRWFPAVWGERFKRLFDLYIRHVLPSGLDHPYLFVSLRAGSDFGRPYTVSAYSQNLEAAVSRIGLESSKTAGTTSHGLRHAYGQSLSDAKVPEKIIQLAMHHKSVASQQVYTRAEINAVNAALTEGQRRVLADRAASLTSIGGLA